MALAWWIGRRRPARRSASWDASCIARPSVLVLGEEADACQHGHARRSTSTAASSTSDRARSRRPRTPAPPEAMSLMPCRRHRPLGVVMLAGGASSSGESLVSSPHLALVNQEHWLRRGRSTLTGHVDHGPGAPTPPFARYSRWRRTDWEHRRQDHADGDHAERQVGRVLARQHRGSTKRRQQRRPRPEDEDARRCLHEVHQAVRVRSATSSARRRVARRTIAKARSSTGTPRPPAAARVEREGEEEHLADEALVRRRGRRRRSPIRPSTCRAGRPALPMKMRAG